jgi:enoyl-CoA hydratase/carnithine racemase
LAKSDDPECGPIANLTLDRPERLNAISEVQDFYDLVDAPADIGNYPDQLSRCCPKDALRLS